MDLNFTPDDEAFRQEVREFLNTRLPDRLSRKVRKGQRLSKTDMEQWHAILNEQGWLASHWPLEYGGTSWSAVQSFIFENECALAGAPRIVPFGVSMLGPVLIRYGTEVQKRQWLPRILNGDDWWCQGYSEPGAGSDLASLKTTATRDGGHYVVNGQKTWTTLGQHANMIFCLVRTRSDAKPQESISFLLIDMASPGIEIRPIITLDGEHEVNEVFFSDVRVPVENLVGEENRGWSCAKYLLTYERTNIAGVGQSTAALERLKTIASRRSKNGLPLDQDPAFAARVAHLEIEVGNMRTTNLRVIASIAAGGATDTVTRAVAERLSQRLGQTFIVNNRPGANATIGTGQAARAKPDGYTFVTVLAAHAVNPHLYNLNYSDDDFTPVAHLADLPLFLFVAKDLPVNTLEELVEYGKANKGILTYASSGTGSSAHLTGANFSHLAGFEMSHVPYKGSAPILTDLLGGRVSMVFDPILVPMPHAKQGDLKVLAVTSSARWEDEPDIPTVAESGFPGFAMNSWVAFLAPAGTPQDIVDKVAAEVAEIAKEDGIIESFKGAGFVPVGTGPAELGALIKRDLKMYGEIVERAKISIN